jgi:hypothetical protein
MSATLLQNGGMNNTDSFRLSPIAKAAADALRQQSGEVYVADQKPGYPCRQCLRDAEIGEELVLVSHDPFTRESPYRSASPIFLHKTPCQPPADLHELTSQLTIRRLSVRAFDRDEMMLDAAVIRGDELADSIADLFSDHAVEQIHVHNADRGCWAVSVARN